jgi:hypothetical protein
MLKRYHNLVARCSRGDDIADLAPEYLLVLNALEEQQVTTKKAAFDFVELDAYVTSIQLISLAILLGQGHTIIVRASILIGNFGVDALYDAILARASVAIAGNSGLRHPTAFSPLYQVLRSRESDPFLLNRYLAGWYAGLQRTYWHGNDKVPGGGYFGYWSFDAALAAKLGGISPNALTGHRHFPVDIVDWVP